MITPSLSHLVNIKPSPISNSHNIEANNVCQSCHFNAVGLDLNLIIKKNDAWEKNQTEEEEPNIFILKCLDCDHLLCYTCYISHGILENLKSHQLSMYPLEKNTESINQEPENWDLKRKFDLSDDSEDNESQKTPKRENIFDSLKLSQRSDLSNALQISELSEKTQSSIEEMWNHVHFIENKIHDTFDFCEKALIDRRDALINELDNILCKAPKQDIGFITNFSTIKSCINETFGYISVPNKQIKPVDIQQLKVNKEKAESIPRIHLNFKFRTKMYMQLSFGGTGLENNRFTEPNGLAVDKNQNIIVADSNSNYMKVFESNGNFRFKFGIEKLLFPNKVACHKPTGNIIIIERKPAHEIKIFNSRGEFIRRFGSGLLKSPRGVCIDRKSRIVILESKVMRILIFSMDGELLKFFDVSSHFRFANSICTSHNEDKIFISDNHSHCIKSFDYEGTFLKEIGGPGLTNYPTSVDMNSRNELLITDNYNCFNLTILTETGEIINAFESKLKHSRILDVNLIDDETLMFSSRDNKIYTYNHSVL